MKLPKSFYNWVSISGSILAVLILFLIILLFVISALFDIGGSYLGLFIYILLPAIMIIGLLMIPTGMLLNKSRLKEESTAEGKPRSLYVDLGNKKHRNAFTVFVIVSFVLLFLTSIGSYEAFHYTESTEFCGELCHSVMEPEFVTYQHSPHARVACVDCHVGEGTDWYVRSKLSGLRQVYAVVSNNFSKPIPTPLHNLRPARETCEKCHWPEKFYARKSYTQKSFLEDSLNTEWDITLLMKTGPEYSALGLKEGIHWHINPNVKIEYIDEYERESLPWVKYTNLETGEVHIYNDEENTLDDSTLNTLPMRTMDCLDCHNRPSHIYKSPPDYIDEAMVAGDIPKEIPFIKHIAMQVLVDPFEDKDTALIFIYNEVINYYQTEHPDYFSSNKALIEKAISGIQTSFSLNSFPGMMAQYDAYPDHIGHLETAGCFRCHSDTHKSESGRVISKDCNLCHTIIAQGIPGKMMSVPISDSLEFVHPTDVEGEWRVGCADCHTYLY